MVLLSRFTATHSEISRQASDRFLYQLTDTVFKGFRLIAVLLWFGSLQSCGLGEDEVQQAIRNLKTGDPGSRGKAALKLGTLRDSRAVNPLIAALADDSEWVRESAAKALGEIRPPEAVAALVTCFLKEKSLRVRSALWNDALRSYQSITLPDNVFTALRDSDPGVREKAASLLGLAPDSRAVQASIAALEDKEDGVRLEAVIALGKSKAPEALEPLISALGDCCSDRVRRAAIEALGKLGDQRAADPILISMLQRKGIDYGGGVHRAASEALKSLGAPQTLLKLAQAARSPEGSKRLIAVGALAGSFDGPIVTDVMKAALEDNDPGVRRCAYEYFLDRDSRVEVSVLLRALKDRDAHNRIHAVQRSDQLMEPASIPSLLALLGDKFIPQGSAYPVSKYADLALRRMGPAAVTTLFASLENPGKPGLREAVIAILASIEDPKVDSYFRDILQKNDSESRSIVGFGYKFYIRNSLAEAEPVLIDHLSRSNDSDMAYVLLNCGNPRLRQAAENWARARGYKIEKQATSLGYQDARWGSKYQPLPQ